MPRGRIEANAGVWRERVQRWKESGLTAKEFAAQEGIARPGALSWWQYHLKQRSKRGSEAPPLQLVRLEPVQSCAADGASELEIEAGRHRIRVSRGFDAELLRRVLSVLDDQQ